jgi:hypothetical protein
VLLGSVQNTSLAAGASYTQSVNFTTSTPGTYYFIVVADSGKVVQTISPAEKQLVSPTQLTVTPAYDVSVRVLNPSSKVAPEGTSILLGGTATGPMTNAPVPFVEVTITITNNGFVRTLQAITTRTAITRLPSNRSAMSRGATRSPLSSPALRRRLRKTRSRCLA